ncbi:hypothetical protein EV363DRAFT_1169214 [Boletus edulis]|nr:hypothetical protein EV363DRAFT_1169214 [Boletus edulis]
MSDIQQNAPDLVELFVHNFLNLPATQPTCRWMISEGQACGAVLPTDPRLVSAHLRNAHHIGGESNAMTMCVWGNCHWRPIQRRSAIRHILSVHLRLLRWRCPQCSRTFSRRGTVHNCNMNSDAVPHA